MQSGTVAKKIGLSVDAIRFYERNGLLPRPPGSQGGFRQDGENDLETLAFIRRVSGFGIQTPRDPRAPEFARQSLAALCAGAPSIFSPPASFLKLPFDLKWTLSSRLWQTTTEDKPAREIIQPRAPEAGYIPAFGSPIFVAADHAASNLPSGSVLARLLHVWNKKMTKAAELYRNPEALATTDRDRHEQLSRKLREARVETTELLDGFEFRLRSEIVSLVDLAEWISLERRCCPFLQFEVNFPRRDGVISWGLTLRGREGVKHFIRSALHI